MSNYDFLEKVKLMPADYQQEIKNFIDFVWEKKLGQPLEKPNRDKIIGAFKGKVWMSPDFDEPLEDFKDYM
ncbi:type II toxin-antitoxin system VapB family antitoxin [Parafilimonas terrae]|jgi:hypothetical protein|uniref:DUF2281 domain-containing protein n=1 Tax=Parafilimonas terrae TaxID=1465490 RepID=A0A1I5XMI1_9BACT|nr:DUF2281 domain-containing protein [Parafilimonas terrae]SFQ33175.1 Protein of unknown function [Parafilimonas terrae]